MENIDALYCRLSKDDLLQGDSASISTQKAMLLRYAKDNGFQNPVYYIDDGYSGTNFERPDFQRLIKDVETGKVRTIIVKDLSRLGRDYLKTGFYLECFFPENKVRFIAINDSVDSNNGQNDFTPFKNIINEWYAKDISKKIKSAYRTKAQKGEFTGAYAPYGYKKDPNNKHKLVINEETAPVVKRIFELAKNGHTVYQITMILKKDEILKPRAKMVQDFNRYASPKFLKYPYDWQTATIYSILGNREYLGHMISNRFTTRSFKDKRIVSIPQDQWIEVSNTHEAIIDQETFDIVQKIVSVKKPKKEPEIQHLFIGLLRCATCGHTLVFHKRAARNSIGCYNCSTYTRYGKGYCSAHYISYENVYNIVLKDIQKHAKLATSDSDRLTRRIMEISNHNCNIKKKQVEKDIIQFER